MDSWTPISYNAYILAAFTYFGEFSLHVRSFYYISTSDFISDVILF